MGAPPPSTADAARFAATRHRQPAPAGPGRARPFVLGGMLAGAATLLVLALLVGPGESVEIKGVVVDGSGDPVPGATVRIAATEGT